MVISSSPRFSQALPRAWAYPESGVALRSLREVCHVTMCSSPWRVKVLSGALANPPVWLLNGKDSVTHTLNLWVVEKWLSNPVPFAKRPAVDSVKWRVHIPAIQQ
jgi:hypothetical protein